VGEKYRLDRKEGVILFSGFLVALFLGMTDKNFTHNFPTLKIKNLQQNLKLKFTVQNKKGVLL